MTTAELARRLRELLAARRRHFTSEAGVVAFSIVASEERFHDIELAAQALEQADAEPARPEDQP